MQKLGVQTQFLPPGDSSRPSSAGSSTPPSWLPLHRPQVGFHQVAKHYYFPGWHQQTSVGEFLVNLKKWQDSPRSIEG